MLHYVRLHLSKLESASPVNLEEANGRDVHCLWGGVCGRELQPASRNWGPHSYNYRALNSINNHVSLEGAPKFQKRMYPGCHLDFSLLRTKLCPDS